MVNLSGTLIAFVIIIVYEYVIGKDRHVRRGSVFKQAQARARELGRPLIVAGDPHNGIGSNFFNWKDGTWGYHKGDHLIDMDPCEQCMRDTRTTKAELGPALSEWDSNSAVVFVSCVLEYIHPLEPTVREIDRVAGGASNIFIVHSDRWSLASISCPSWLAGHPGICNVINRAPPETPFIEYRAIC